MAELRDKGIKFLNIPDSYYETTYKILKDHWVATKIDLEILHKNQILLDFDNQGFLL